MSKNIFNLSDNEINELCYFEYNNKIIFYSDIQSIEKIENEYKIVLKNKTYYTSDEVVVNNIKLGRSKYNLYVSMLTEESNQREALIDDAVKTIKEKLYIELQGVNSTVETLKEKVDSISEMDTGTIEELKSVKDALNSILK